MFLNWCLFVLWSVRPCLTRIGRRGCDIGTDDDGVGFPAVCLESMVSASVSTTRRCPWVGRPAAAVSHVEAAVDSPNLAGDV
jgi:hypothetical protein